MCSKGMALVLRWATVNRHRRGELGHRGVFQHPEGDVVEMVGDRDGRGGDNEGRDANSCGELCPGLGTGRKLRGRVVAVLVDGVGRDLETHRLG